MIVVRVQRPFGTCYYVIGWLILEILPAVCRSLANSIVCIVLRQWLEIERLSSYTST